MQPPHRFDAEQAVERNTVTGAFPPAAAVRRISNLLARSFLSAGLFAQILTQDTDSQLSTRVFWKAGEEWRRILDAEFTSEGTCVQGLHEVLFQMDQAISHRPLVTNFYSLYCKI